MGRYISALEISDTEVRLAVGYLKDNKVNLIHVAERPIHGLVSHGEIVDFSTLASIISSMKEFKDASTKEKIVINLFLSVIALFFVVVISFPLGIYVAKHTGGISDKIISPLNQASMSIPSFVLGLLITFFFGIVLRWFKPGGYVSFNTNFGGFLYFLIFPAFALAIPKIAMCIRLLKGNILEEAGKDYSLTAYARGNNTTGLLYRHVLKNAIMPTITFIGMIAADMIGSGIVIEQVFSIPGLGQMLISSISTRDFPVVEAEVMMIALFIMLISFLTDIIHALIDPRVRI